jgi:hypothetical protein
MSKRLIMVLICRRHKLLDPMYSDPWKIVDFWGASSRVGFMAYFTKLSVSTIYGVERQNDS